jgi:predicted permease
MDALLHDLRIALRRLWARPGLTAAGALTLALGMGANTAVFSLIRGILLEPLPYAEPDRLVMVWRPVGESDQTWLSLREWVEYNRATRSFQHLAAYDESEVNLTEGVEPERVRGAFVTGNTFAALGVPALRGRTFGEAEDVSGRDAVVVIGFHLWQRRFAGAPDVVGRTLRINGQARTVLGVMPPDFRLPLDYREDRPTELWLPMAVNRANPGGWGDRGNYLFGRLRPGVTAGAASADLQRAEQQWEAAGLVSNRDGRLTRYAVPLNDLLTGSLRTPLLLLFGAVGFILLIACANVTNLLLARADARRREVATQAALGATRLRIARELLLESAMLVAIGTALGVALAFGGLRATLALTPVNLLRMRDISVDGWVFGFSALLAIATTLLAGLAPALQLARVELAAAMSAGGRSAALPMRRRLRHALVIAQTALSVILVIGAGLLTRSLAALRNIELGFNVENVLTFRLALPAAEYPTTQPERAFGFYRELIDRLEGLQGVRSAAAVRVLPLSNTIGDWSITIEGRAYDPGENPNGDWQVATPGYFETMNIQLARGRFFTDADRESSPGVAIIDEHMASKYWPGQDALGKRFHLGTMNQPWVTIVGITKPVRHNAVVEEPRTEMVIPHAQFAAQTGYAPLGMTVVIKTQRDPLMLLEETRAQVKALDPNLPIGDVRTMDRVAAGALAQPRFLTIMLGLFAALALTLAGVGMYGVIAYIAARREHEIGIRMALGAGRALVVRMVLGEGVALALAGVALGLAGAAWLTRFLASQLYGVQRLDPVTFAVVPVALILVASLAAWLPARRAAAVDPNRALQG